jgi:metal-responsive CopG/Arc/MetJ family transcriptional regulator
VLKQSNTRIQHTIPKTLLRKVEGLCAKEEIDRREWINQAIREKLERSASAKYLQDNPTSWNTHPVK